MRARSCCSRGSRSSPATARPPCQRAFRPPSTSSIRACSRGSPPGASRGAMGQRGSMDEGSRDRWSRTSVRHGREPGGRACLGALAALALGVSFASAASAGAEDLKPYQATYYGIWNGFKVGVSRLELKQTGDTWTYSSRSEPRGIGRMAHHLFPPLQVSVVRVTSAGLQPQSYTSGDNANPGRDSGLTYDWRSARVRGTYEGTAVDLPLGPSVQDDASVQLALMVELLAGRTPSSFALIDRNGVRDYRFEREGTATLKTPLGEVATVIYGARKAHSPRLTRFWCAPERGYIPMKVEQTKGEEVQWTLEIES